VTGFAAVVHSRPDGRLGCRCCPIRSRLWALTQLELGRTVEEIATAKAAGDDPEVVEEVVSSDALGMSDEIRVGVTRGPVDDGGEEGGDGDEAP
jgi:hypothetical protein